MKTEELLTCIICHTTDAFTGYFRARNKVVCQLCCEVMTPSEYQIMVADLNDTADAQRYSNGA